MRNRSLALWITIPSIIAAAVFSNCSDHQAVSNEKERLKMLHYENSSGEKAVTVYDYDPRGNNFRAEWRLVDGERSSVNYHKYDTSGNLLEKYREFSDGLTSLTTYEYNDAGQLINGRFYRSDTIEGSIMNSYVGVQKIRSRCQNWNGWFTADIYYSFEDSVLTKGYIYKDTLMIGEIHYTYSGKGLLQDECWQIGEWQQLFRYEYEIPKDYPKPDFTYSNPFVTPPFKYRIISEEYNFNGNIGGPSEYQYQNGMLAKKTFTRSDSFRTTTHYRYTPDNILLSSKREYPDGRTTDFMYHYNDRYQLCTRTYKESGKVTGREEYFYDDTGALSHAVYKNMDGWLTGRLVFEYDEKGRLAAGTFTGEGVPDAAISFVYNNMDCLTDIHWQFENGTTQDYHYSYGKDEK